jgi:hypothetical protein
MTPCQLRVKLNRLRADEQRAVAVLDAVQQRIALVEAELTDALEAERRAAAERRSRVEAQRRKREAAKERRRAERLEAERVRAEAMEAQRRERESQERVAAEYVRALTIQVARAASEHYGTPIRAQAILGTNGGTRRVLDARRALVWLGRERAGLKLRVLGKLLGRSESDISQVHQRPMSMDAAAIVRLFLLRDVETPVQSLPTIMRSRSSGSSRSGGFSESTE